MLLMSNQLTYNAMKELKAKWMDKSIYHEKQNKQSDIPILVTGKIDFMSKEIVTDTVEHFAMKKKNSSVQEDKRILKFKILNTTISK